MTSVQTFHFRGAVSAEERVYYEENGFIVYRGMVPSADVAVLTADADQYHDAVQSGAIAPEHVDDVAPVTRENGNTLHHRLNYFTMHCDDSRRIVHEQAFAALGDAFVGPFAWLLEDTMNGVVWQIKRGGPSSAYSSMRWHRDFPAEHQLSPVVTVGIYLDQSTRANGCLAVVPKSHRNPVGPCAPEPLFLEVEPGDVICHHERLYHASSPMTDASGSRATVYLYYCGGAYPGPGLPFASPDRFAQVRAIFRGSAPSAKTESPAS